MNLLFQCFSTFERVDSPTIPATELIIQKLQEDGYIFKTVSQLIQGSADSVLLTQTPQEVS